MRKQSRLPFLCVSFVLVLTFGIAPRGNVASADDASEAAWKKISPYFEVPAEFADKMGDYRSPLVFADGSKVNSADDWKRRRAELFSAWMTLMGPWPKVIDHPKVEQLSEADREGITQRRVRIEIAPEQTGEGWLMIPPGAGPFPAVLVVYYEPETSIGINPKQTLRDFGWQFPKRGFVTLNIGTPGGNAYKPEIGQSVCQPLSFHAYVAANCWNVLADTPRVDSSRIGVVGHSYGGKWSMFAGALWEKFASVAVSDPGIVFDEKRPSINYWEPWYLGLDPNQKRPKAGIPTADNPRTGAYKQMLEQHRDLHEIHALIAPRPFFVSGGSEDFRERWIALNHLVSVNNLLGVPRHVGMSNRPDHTPTEESNEILYSFFEYSLANRSKDK